MMKIAHTFQGSSMRFFEPAAAQLHIYHTIRGLQQAGHHVALLALQGRQALFTPDLGVFKHSRRAAGQFGKLGVSGARPFKWVESALRRFQTITRLPYLALFDSYRMYDACRQNLSGFDVIHERFNLLALGSAWASKKLGIPLVLEVNADLIAQRNFKGKPEKGVRRLYARWATRACFNAAAKIVCISADLKDHLHRNWGVEERKLVVLPCAADIEAFGQARDTAPLRQEFSLTGGPVVMWVGGFYHWHNLDLLLDSFAGVLQHHPQARLVLVGDGETRPAIEQKIARNGLRAAVTLTGAVSHHRVPELVAAADVLVAPDPALPAGSGGTGTPLKLFEYMAAGKAIVATASSQAEAAIQHGRTGLLVPAGRADLFAGAIEHLLGNPAERARLGQNARQQARERHSWQVYTRQLEAIYHQILA